MSAFLLATDLDNTLVGDDTALTRLNRYLEDNRQTQNLKLVYITGRSLYLYRQLAQEKPLLTPDALITAVGTEIYFAPQQNQFDSDWASRLAPGWDRDRLTAIAAHFADLELQPLSEQNPYKISYFLRATTAEILLAQLRSQIEEQGLQAQLIYSGGQDLDILPEKGDKGLALQYLRQRWAIKPEQTVVCGDSGNDIALFCGPERGIIVGNARPELLQWYEMNPRQHHYLAQGHYAKGILEGLAYFGFFS
ncbi:MAG: sucrose-phosphate phosphatase [Chloroflexaceae bacterium]|nr:sucrose-phosphate phosphatase [Chloroflexaceae bacterium]